VTSAFGGQRSIQLSYGCTGDRLANDQRERYPLSRAGSSRRYLRAIVTGWNGASPQLAPRMIGADWSTVMMSLEHSCDSDVS
jgi:hypothetical protein